MADETAQILLKRLDSLVVQRQTWESHWQEVADYVVAAQGRCHKKQISR